MLGSVQTGNPSVRRFVAGSRLPIALAAAAYGPVVFTVAVLGRVVAGDLADDLDHWSGVAMLAVVVFPCVAPLAATRGDLGFRALAFASAWYCVFMTAFGLAPWILLPVAALQALAIFTPRPEISAVRVRRILAIYAAVALAFALALIFSLDGRDEEPATATVPAIERPARTD